MKKISLLLLIAIAATSVFAQRELNIMTFNIRLDVASDSLNAWPYRKDKVAAQVLFHKADILGVQEALYSQMTDLQKALTDYRYLGVGRDDGKMQGEYSAVFYNTKRLELIRTATCWLSETPNEPGKKGWDAACARVVSWGNFKDKLTDKTFFVFNTHFDHLGIVARRESAKLILHLVDSIAGKDVAIVTGDFNAAPADEPIQIVTNPTSKIHLTDTKAISLKPHYGPTGTFTAFGPREISDEPIDYIFFNRGITVTEHATLSESWMGRFASDHFAVIAKIIL